MYLISIKPFGDAFDLKTLLTALVQELKYLIFGRLDHHITGAVFHRNDHLQSMRLKHVCYSPSAD